MRSPWLAALFLILPCFAATGAAQQQDRTCDIARSGRIDNRDEIATFFDPFAFQCTDGTVLSANEGTLNKITREIHLIGNVYYKDPTRTLTARDAVYNNGTGRLYATGNVVFTDETQGMTMRGPEMEYYKVMLPSRPQPQVNAAQRPHLTLRPKPKPGALVTQDEPPLEIDGDRMALVGENDLSMFGNVVIERPDLRATAGEARYDGATEGLELRENAAIHNPDYTLRGEVIQARMPGGELEHVESHTHSFLEGKDLTVTSAELQMFFEGGELQRTVARGDGEDVERPLAVSKSFRLQADSLDALMPARQLQQVVAIGNARGESVDTTRADSAVALAAAAPDSVARPDSAAAAPDSVARPDSAAAAPASALALLESDWIVGDTITGFFALAPDTTQNDTAGVVTPATKPDSTTVLKRILARGSALSLYRIDQKKPAAAADTTEARARAPERKGINFLSGSEIELTFEGGQLMIADVRGLEKGLYLDPNQTLGARPAATPPAEPAPDPEEPEEPVDFEPAPAAPGGNG
jgi:lipopolysaccharide export system protein LptA